MSVSPIDRSRTMDLPAKDIEHQHSSDGGIVQRKTTPEAAVLNNSDFTDNDTRTNNNSKSTTTSTTSWYKRQDVWMLVSGLVFILVLLAMIAAVGNARGWDADTSLEHNQSETSQDRCDDSNITHALSVYVVHVHVCLAWKCFIYVYVKRHENPL